MRHSDIKRLGKAMNRIERKIKRRKPRLVHSEFYSWYELTLKRINWGSKTRNSPENKIGLKLVG